MKTSVTALILLLLLLVGAILGEVYTVKATDRLLEQIEEDADGEQIREVLGKHRRLLSIMMSHEDLREVEVALGDYEIEPTEENKSRLRDSVKHLKRLLFIGYFIKSD